MHEVIKNEYSVTINNTNFTLGNTYTYTNIDGIFSTEIKDTEFTNFTEFFTFVANNHILGLRADYTLFTGKPMIRISDIGSLEFMTTVKKKNFKPVIVHKKSTIYPVTISWLTQNLSVDEVLEYLEGRKFPREYIPQ